MSQTTKHRALRAFAVSCLVLLIGSTTAGQTVVRALIDRPDYTVYSNEVGRAVDEAQHSIHVLLSNCEVDGSDLVERLITAHRRGIAVHVVLDASDWAPSMTERNRPAYRALSAAGVDVVFDDPDVTAHAKLVVVDRQTVFVGSTHWNRYALTDHRQADICIVDPRIGDVFAEYVERIRHGKLPAEGLEIAGAPAGPAVIALPDTAGTCLYATMVLDLLRSARISVHIIMYRASVYPQYADSLSNRLVDAVCDAARRGLDVRVLLDDCQSYPESAEANLMAALVMAERGVDVRLDSPGQTTHAKMVLIDGETLVIGSTNWNYYALERNVETSVALIGIPAVAAPYEAFFEHLWSEGRRPGG